MNDTKLDPRSLTAEERAIVESTVTALASCGFGTGDSRWESPYGMALERIEYSRALFAPTESEPEKAEWTGNVKCPDCGRLVNEAHCGGPNHVYQRAQPAPVAEGEMPEAVEFWGVERTKDNNLIGPMRSDGFKVRNIVFHNERGEGLIDGAQDRHDAEADLVAAAVNAYRSQPVARVEMTPELERLLTLCESIEIASDRQVTNSIHTDAKVVRAQATAPKGKP